MTSTVRTIAIAGAGIGGLAAALALARRGLASHIFERRPGLNEDGAGIQIGPNGCGVLAELGVLDRVHEHAAEPDALSVHDGKSGRVVTRLPLGAFMRDRHSAPYLTMHRQDLHAALFAAASTEPKITITPGCAVEGFSNRDDGVDLNLSAGNALAADALIAADGLWSQLRSHVAGPAQLQPFGKCAFRTVLPRSALPKSLAANDVHIWLAPGTHAVHYPVRQGRDIALIIIIDANAFEDSWNIESTPDWQATFSDVPFAPELLELLKSAQHWRSWPLQTLPPLPSWTNGNVALLGDAAHPVLPFFAQGGALALEDAVVLAANIANTTVPMTSRLKAYEVARRVRVLRVTDASRSNGGIYHMRGATAAARNAVMTAVPPALLMRRYDWLYGWKI
jgi:salicylate hydroxylase